MSSIGEIVGSLLRRHQAERRNELPRAFSRFSDAVHVLPGAGRPVYTASDATRGLAGGEPLFRMAGVAAPNGTPGAAERGLDAEAFGAVRLFWRNADGGTRETVSLRLWVLTELGWLLLDGQARDLLGENREMRLAELGYRRIYVEVTAIAGGEGAVDVYVGGEA